MRKIAALLTAVAGAIAVSTTQASALVIGVSGSGSASGMATLLNANGHTATHFGGSAPNAAQLAGLDALVLVRTPGNADVETFVNGGGLLITEWNASVWALNTAGLLDATDSGGGIIATSTPVTFTSAGIAAGLSVDLPNPYSDSGSTQFFRDLTAIGAGVDILATRPGDIPAIIAGASGLGQTLIIGYDWRDGPFDANVDTPSEQLLLNAVLFNGGGPVAVPEPGTLALLGVGLMALGSMRRRLTRG